MCINDIQRCKYTVHRDARIIDKEILIPAIVAFFLFSQVFFRRRKKTKGNAGQNMIATRPSSRIDSSRTDGGLSESLNEIFRKLRTHPNIFCGLSVFLKVLLLLLWSNNHANS